MKKTPREPRRNTARAVRPASAAQDVAALSSKRMIRASSFTSHRPPPCRSLTPSLPADLKHTPFTSSTIWHRGRFTRPAWTQDQPTWHSCLAHHECALRKRRLVISLLPHRLSSFYIPSLSSPAMPNPPASSPESPHIISPVNGPRSTFLRLTGPSDPP